MATVLEAEKTPEVKAAPEAAKAPEAKQATPAKKGPKTKRAAAKKGPKAKKAGARKRAVRRLVARALTNMKFRKLLAKNPAKALGVDKLSKANEKEIRLALAAVKGVNAKVAELA